MKLIAKVAEREGELLRRESERARREIENTYAKLGLGRSTDLLDALLEKDFAGIRASAQRMTEEYERFLGPLKDLVQRDDFAGIQASVQRIAEENERFIGPLKDLLQQDDDVRRTVEKFIADQSRLTEDRLRRDAELAGIGFDYVSRQIREASEDLVRDILKEIEIVEERKRLTREAAWPSLGTSPLDVEKAKLTTQLFDRNVLETDLPRALEFADREGLQVALVMIDLNHLKGINTDFGHPAGDRALLKVADCLRAVVGTKGRGYRYGGDEFAILLPNFTADEALALAERLRRSVGQGRIEGVTRQLSISLGISTYPEQARNSEELKKQADDALYASKDKGRNRTTLYEEDLRRV